MKTNPKPCRWCDKPNPNHWPFQCNQNPKRRKYRIPVAGNVSFKYKRVREVWFRENPPNPFGFYICYLCGKWLKPIDTELDHVESRSRRPDLRYELSNLKSACTSCNTAKGSLSLEEYYAKIGKDIPSGLS